MNTKKIVAIYVDKEKWRKFLRILHREDKPLSQQQQEYKSASQQIEEWITAYNREHEGTI